MVVSPNDKVLTTNREGLAHQMEALNMNTGSSTFTPTSGDLFMKNGMPSALKNEQPEVQPSSSNPLPALEPLLVLDADSPARGQKNRNVIPSTIKTSKPSPRGMRHCFMSSPIRLYSSLNTSE